MGPRLELRQSQSLVMTPQLMQAIKLLQLSSLDLAAYVENELERNPLLERDDAEDAPSEAQREASRRDEDVDSSGDGDSGDASDGTASLSDGEPGDLVSASSSDINSLTPSVDADIGEAMDETSAFTPGTGAPSALPGAGGDDYNLEEFVSANLTLADHLLEQLGQVVAPPLVKAVCERLIGYMDDNGYLATSLEEFAEQLGIAMADAEAALEIVHQMEPVGVGARSLAECLALQLKEKDRLDPVMQCLLENLQTLAKRDFTALKRICGVDQEDLADMVMEIRALDPKPGSRFGFSPVQPVVPDVFVRMRADGGWAIDLNADTLPRVLVNRGYYSSVIGTVNGTDDRMWLNNCLQEANWLIKSLDQRARTVLKVATEIVRQQDAFLMRGIAYLRPLNLKQVAEAIDMHESTISRVTANKYMATPRGLFELKYFFPTAIAATGGGDAHSGESVRHRIRAMIEAEGKAVLSDDQIVKALQEDGVDIARRTVAKYRESLGIPSSVQRRRESRALT
ncbi:RNA polymerase factor sigma-54 [Tepidamorphus sp. 3E244]|uniref:RNA polymerase factor sigma-54 n=1 Tax=Tepidamorphus sp. 3E244 TaxID=3385498 RepID=UPI0038FBFB5F